MCLRVLRPDSPPARHADRVPNQTTLTPRQWLVAPKTFGRYASPTLRILVDADNAPVGPMSELLAAVSQHTLALRAMAHIAHLSDSPEAWLGRHRDRLGAPGTVINQLYGHKTMQWDVACNLASLLGPDVWPHPELLRAALDRAAQEYIKVASRAQTARGRQ